MSRSSIPDAQNVSSNPNSNEDGSGSSSANPHAPPRWTFLTNHAHVLIALNENPDTVLREIAGQVGITERAVQRIVQELEEGGFIHREKVGRQNRYEVVTDRALRHPLESHRNIGELLELISKSS